MIPQAEITAEAARWGIQQQVVEKDYTLGWLLAGISQHPELAESWIFKGGTCLRKCYYETFRFSEDLDFTVTSEGSFDEEVLKVIFYQISEWIFSQIGLKLVIDEKTFKTTINKRGNPCLQIRIGYVGPNPQPINPKIKIDLTNDELIAGRVIKKEIHHSYSDWTTKYLVSSYSLEELTAEKIRALYERCRPRDLYDVIHLYKNPNLIGVARTVKVLLEAKCQYVGIDFPTPASVKTDENKRDLVSDWNDMLAHQLPPPLLDWEPFWDEIDLVFDWLNGASTPISLPPAPHDAIPSTLLDASALNFSRSGINMQLLRYSALNRLKIVIYYEPTNGEIGPRKIEPYSLRETKDRKVLLFAVNGEGELRSYRLDRIHGMSPTNTKYVPRYKVEIG